MKTAANTATTRRPFVESYVPLGNHRVHHRHDLIGNTGAREGISFSILPGQVSPD